ncbi:MAG: SsrA-binding protein SmpB [Holosporales bacterium]|jgi:SsrA-binding protein|nr:SsrA-binding protein SmpB [Holosporales bacterium]
MATKNNNFKIVAKNKKSRFEYEIMEIVETGIVLTGSEIKSIRNGKISINESFVGGMDNSDDLFLFNADISPYMQASYNNHESKRPRKLLMHQREINKFLGAIRKKGLTVVPLTMYFNHKGFIKLSIALARGKNIVDKRETIKEREWNIQKSRVLKNYNQ